MQTILQDIHIGANLRRLRRERGLTQEQLVARLQLRGSAMSRSTYSKIETESRNIKASDLFALSEILGVALEELLKPPSA